jgi:hypothetical protein
VLGRSDRRSPVSGQTAIRRLPGVPAAGAMDSAGAPVGGSGLRAAVVVLAAVIRINPWPMLRSLLYERGSVLDKANTKDNRQIKH